jgi:hypothetical protein
LYLEDTFTTFRNQTKMSTQFSNQTDPSLKLNDFFDLLMDNTSVIRITSLTFCFVSVFVLPFLLYTIIWYDKYGSDQRRTFINMLNTSICWLWIEYCIVVQSTEFIRFMFGPLPKMFCFFKTIVRSAYVSQILMYYDTIAVAKYIFIFWLTNPAAFQDEFWIRFVNIWIKGASLIFNFVWFTKAEHQIINYYICSGLDPTEDFKKDLKVYGVPEIVSMLINLAIFIRIQVFKNTGSDILLTKSEKKEKLIHF